MQMVLDLLAAAERVKSVVETTERCEFITQAEFDRLHTYQFSTPTGPKPGFRYKREYWRIPGEVNLWHGPNESHVRVAISKHQRQHKGVPGDTFPPAHYDGPLESIWFVFTCVSDPHDRNYIVHRPKEAKVIQ